MSQLIALVKQALGQRELDSISKQLGTSPEQAQSAIDQALPMLIGAMSSQKNATSGWGLLSSFLDKNQDGRVIDDLMRMALRSRDSQQGTAAAQQLLGPSQGAVTQHLEQNTGMSSTNVQSLLTMLAPVIIGALAKVQQSEGLDQEGLAQKIEVERESIAASSPETRDLMTSVFDRNKDGSIVDDITRMGSAILGSFRKAQ